MPETILRMSDEDHSELTTVVSRYQQIDERFSMNAVIVAAVRAFIKTEQERVKKINKTMESIVGAGYKVRKQKGKE